MVMIERDGVGVVTVAGQPVRPREVAAAFHWSSHDRYVFGDGMSPELTASRLWLVDGARLGLSSGLEILGVSAPAEL